MEGWAWAVPSTVGEARQLLEHMFAEVCARIFLAGRADKQYCSSACQSRTKAKRYYHEVGREKRAEHGGKLP